MLPSLLAAFGIKAEEYRVAPFGTGLINHTWKAEGEGQAFILQRVNDHVFKNPWDIARNIQLLSGYLAKEYPGYLFVAPLTAKNGEQLVYFPEEGYFRAFPFMKNSVSYEAVKSPHLAFEAARQFGLFTKLLSRLDATQLHITLPGFHDLSLRYRQFEEALQYQNRERIREASESIRIIQAHKGILDTYEKIKKNPSFRIRVAHHDTKISNVLFDESGKGLCVIDLDTVMPGYFISDTGDMMRTYLSPVTEEEKDFSKIEVRKEYYKAIIEGYLSEMGDELTPAEKEHFSYAGAFMIYMQALRFITDHLNNDRYYGAKYEGHNLVRGQNQMVLLEHFLRLNA